MHCPLRVNTCENLEFRFEPYNVVHIGYVGVVRFSSFPTSTGEIYTTHPCVALPQVCKEASPIIGLNRGTAIDFVLVSKRACLMNPKMNGKGPSQLCSLFGYEGADYII